jgi:antitoxin (DNA-binding transcriptional repressor) of toxin-antitoxin stability system
MNTMTVSEAKPFLGKLVDAALKNEAVYIRRGKQVVQIVPAVLPEPITAWPEGAFARSGSDIAFLTQDTGADEDAPFIR